MPTDRRSVSVCSARICSRSATRTAASVSSANAVRTGWPRSISAATKRMQYCNWAQALEGEFDQSHVSYIHTTIDGSPVVGNPLVDAVRSADTHPTFEVVAMPYGTCIAAGRDAPGALRYWRITHHFLPFYSMTGPYGPNPPRVCRAWVPIDDTNALVIGIMYHPLHQNVLGDPGVLGARRCRDAEHGRNRRPHAGAPRNERPPHHCDPPAAHRRCERLRRERHPSAAGRPPGGLPRAATRCCYPPMRPGWRRRSSGAPLLPARIRTARSDDVEPDQRSCQAG